MKKLTLILLTLTLITSCRKTKYVAPNPMDDGLVAYYPLDGHTNDLTNFKNHGTTNAKVGADRRQMPSLAYTFDTSYFQSSNIPINLSKKYTFSFWVKMNKYNDGMAIMELAKPSEGNPNDIPCNLNPQIWQFRDSLYLTTASNINNSIYIMSLRNIKYQNTSSWTHVAWTVSDNTTKMYVNGTLISTREMPWPNLERVNLTLGNAGNTCLGDMNVPNFHNQPSFCSIDEVRVYNRTLSDSEISKLSLK